MDKNIQRELKLFIKDYTDMDINGVTIHCPYWMNRIAGGVVVIRGFLNGKGEAKEIKQEIMDRLNNMSSESFSLTPIYIRKFAKRERIGIDCSGFVYRVLNKLISLINHSQVKDINEIFPDGINKTSARMLISLDVCSPVTKISDYQIGDMIRLWDGKHIAAIIGLDGKEITYAHASSLSTEIQGVHTSVIRITDIEKPLKYQNWLEKTRMGENFGKNHFHPDAGDGVYRLRIFSK